jgi:hypothetical protein
MEIMMGIYPKNPYVLILKYMGGLHSHLRKQVMFLKIRTMDEVCVQEQYLENIGPKKGNPSGSRYKENQEYSKDGKKKWKWGKYKNTKTTTQHCKGPKTITNSATLMATPRKCFGNYIQR